MTSITDQVDALFTQWTIPDSPGCVIAIIREGQVLYTRGYGMADVEQRLPLTSMTLFNIGSTAKQFTAMSIALLAEQHALALNGDIRVYLPELPSYTQAITIRHLIHHISGLRECLTLLIYAGKSIEVVLPSVALEILARQQELNFPSGQQYQYCNSNYGLLALIFERVTGASLSAWTRQHIFDPLGMRQTQFYSPLETSSGQRATGYWVDETGRYVPGPGGIGLLGAGGLYTTVEDLARWDENFYHPTVGDQELINRLVTPTALATGRPIHLVVHLYMPRHSVTLTPVDPTHFQVADALDPTTVTFERPNPSAPLRMHMVVEGEEAQTFVAFQRAAPQTDQLEDYIGAYWSDELQVTWRVALEGNQLVNAYSAPFEPTMEDGFRGPFDMHIEFFRDEQRRVTGFNLYAQQASKIRFERATEEQQQCEE
jgi:CubicO group peptidase (beta-lactamase class C family)